LLTEYSEFTKFVYLIFSDPENGGAMILRGKTLMVQEIKPLNITFLSLGEGSLSPPQGPVVTAV
jgi:hypothetical protein